MRTGQLLVGQMRDLQLAVESAGEGFIRLGDRERARLTVHRHLPVLHRQAFDATDATHGVEELAGRIDLERTHRQRQLVFVRHLVGVAQPITCDQLRLIRLPLHEAGNAQAELVMLPVDRGYRQIAILQRLRGDDIRPTQHLAVQYHERFDAEAGLGRFQRAVLAHQCLLAAAVQAQQRPVRLLAAEATWQRAARQIGTDRADEIVRRVGKGQRLEADVTDAVTPAGAVLQIKAQVTRFGFRQGQPIATATTGIHFAQLVPIAPVTRCLHHVARSLQARHPLHHRTAEFTHLAQVQADGLLLHAAADPQCVRLAVGDALLQCGGGVGDDDGGQRRGVFLRQRLQGQLIEAHRAATTDLAVDGELHRCAAPQRLVFARPPCLFDMALAVIHTRPALGELIAGAVHPPHVVAAGIDEFELQVVGRRIPAQFERDLIVLGPGDVQFATDAGITGNFVEVVIQAQGAAVVATDRPQRTADLRRGDQLPGVDVIELRQDRSGTRQARAQQHGKQQTDGALTHHQHLDSCPTIRAGFSQRTLPCVTVVSSAISEMCRASLHHHRFIP
ncbi:hypothetical protein D3C81_631930 [compost metagenome]